MGFVLIVGDAGLRSALAARLTLAGAAVLTANSLHEPAVQRRRASRTVLVLDERGLSSHADHALDALHDDGCWEGIVMLTTTAQEPPAASRIVFVHHADAAQALERFLPRRVS